MLNVEMEFELVP